MPQLTLLLLPIALLAPTTWFIMHSSYSIPIIFSFASSVVSHPSNTPLDLSWHAPPSTKVSDLNSVVNGTDVWGFVFNSSMTPAGLPYCKSTPKLQEGLAHSCKPPTTGATCLMSAPRSTPRSTRATNSNTSTLSTAITSGLRMQQTLSLENHMHGSAQTRVYTTTLLPSREPMPIPQHPHTGASSRPPQIRWLRRASTAHASFRN